MKFAAKWYVAACLLMASVSETAGQTQINLRTQSRDVDFSQASSTKPFRTGASLPETCATGEAYLRTEGEAGLYVCTVTDTWMQAQSSGSTSTELVVVPFSAAPIFNASRGGTQKLTLNGDVTGATLTGAVAGQTLTLVVCQDGTGGWRFQWPANMSGAQPVPTAAHACVRQAFVYDGTTALAIGAGHGDPYLVAAPTANLPNASVLTQGYGVSVSCLAGGNCVVSAVDMTHYCASAASGGTNYACNLSPAPAGLSTGMSYYFRADQANTGPCTLNFNSLGERAIKTANGSDPPAGMIVAGAMVQVVYDGTSMQIINAGGAVQSVGASAPLVSSGGQNPTIGANLTGTGDKVVTSQAGSSPAANDCAKWVSDGQGGMVLSGAGAACGTSSLPASVANQVLAAGPNYGDPSTVVTPRPLVAEDMPAMVAMFQDNQIVRGPVDAAGNPNSMTATSGLGAGCGGACTVTINGSVTPVEMFIGGKYQKLTSAVTVPLTSNAANYIFALQDTARASMAATDFVATTNAPFHQYAAPSCPLSGVSGTNPSYWFDLGAGRMKVCTSNGGAYTAANPPAILYGVAYVDSTPAVLGVAADPYRLGPYRRRELFGEGEEDSATNPAAITGTTQWNGVVRRRGVIVNGGTISTATNDQRALGLYIVSQLPVLVLGNGSIHVNGAGEMVACYGTGTGTVGTRAYGPGGAGGGGGYGTNNGGTGGAKMIYYNALSVGQGATGGAGGTAGSPAGRNGADFTLLFGSGVFPGFAGTRVNWLVPPTGATGGCGGGDGASAGGQAGYGGGFLGITAPGIVLAAGSKISADGGAGANAAAGNTGGGGGGGGGVAIVYAGYLTDGADGQPVTAITADGGSGGAGQGSGASGGNGARGVGQFVRMW